MVTRIVKTIGTGGDFSTPSLWVAGQPNFPMGFRGSGQTQQPSANKWSASTFVGTFTQNEALTSSGGPALAAGVRMLDTDGATYITTSANSDYGLKVGITLVGGTSGATCLLTAQLDNSGAVWEGQVLNQEVDNGANEISLGDQFCTKDCYRFLTAAPGASFMDNVNAATNPLRYDGTKGAAIKVSSTSGVIFNSFNFDRVSKLQFIQNNAAGQFAMQLLGGNSGFNLGTNVADNLIVENLGGSGAFKGGIFALGESIVRNCVGIQRGAADRALVLVFANLSNGVISLINCTLVVPDDDTPPPSVIKGFSANGTLNVTNCSLFLGDSSQALSAGTMPGTVNYVTSLTDVTGTTGITQTTYGNEFVDNTDAGRDFRLKAGAVAIGAGTLDQFNALNDVVGTPRPQGTGYDIGAWEYNVTLDQVHYRFRTDAGAVDANPTWGAAQDTTYAPGLSSFRLRFGIANNKSIPQGPSSYQVYVSRNGGAYQAVTTSSQYVQAVDAGSDPDGTIIKVPRLTAAP